MKKMTCGLLGGMLLLCLASVPARGDELASFELSLFGYRIGMSYDQAASVRPFVRVIDRGGETEEFCGLIDHLWVDGVDVRVQTCFFQDRIHKVVGKFSPSLVEDLVARLQPLLGKGENRSMLLQTPDGGQVSNRIQKWRYPGMLVVLVGSSRNTEFATLSMVARPSPAGMAETVDLGD